MFKKLMQFICESIAKLFEPKIHSEWDCPEFEALESKPYRRRANGEDL